MPTLASQAMNSQPDDITTQVIEIIATTMYIPVENIRADSTYEELGIDSLGGLTIVGEIEDVFGIEIPNEEALQITDIPQTIACLLSRLGNDSPATQERAEP